MELQTPMPVTDWTAQLSKLIDHVLGIFIGLITVEAVLVLVAVLIFTHLVKGGIRRFAGYHRLQRYDIYAINFVLGIGVAFLIWPRADVAPWWIAGPAWGTAAHYAFRLFKIVLEWKRPDLYAKWNFDRRRARQKRPAHRERRKR